MTLFDKSAFHAGDLAMGFSGNLLVRDGENRTGETLGLALADPAARVFMMYDGLWLCQGEGDRRSPFFDAETASSHAAGGETVLLGHTPAGAPRLAMRIATLPAEETGIAPYPLRQLAMGGALDADTEGQLGQAEHFLNWHARSQFCGRCGAATVSDAAGYRRRCTACDDVLFPRTDPVSIMLIHDGAGRCLLGRSPRFPEKMWSCLAGFIEPGETLEAAVRRETLEEAGIAVGEVRYFASQPWPFPGSLMIGCIGIATSLDIDFDGVELEDCRWFDRADVAAMLAGAHPDGLTAPKPFAIAHHLVKAFIDLGD